MLYELAEKMGTGIQDMIKSCSAYGLPEPEFKMTDAFTVTIKRKKNLRLNKLEVLLMTLIQIK